MTKLQIKPQWKSCHIYPSGKNEKSYKDVGKDVVQQDLLSTKGESEHYHLESN